MFHTNRPLNQDSLQPLGATVPPSGSDNSVGIDRKRWDLKAPIMTAATMAALAAGLWGATDAPKTWDKRTPGTPEIKRLDVGKPTRWDARQVAVTLDPSLDALGDDARESVRGAYGAWIESVDTLPSFAFNVANSKGEAKQDGVNRVIAAPITLPGHKNDLAITISYVSTEGPITEADMIINTKHAYCVNKTNGCKKSYDLQNVATHEVGHFLGLGEDRDDREATMYFMISPGETKKRTLSEVDWMSVERLYEFESSESDDAGVSCAVAPPRPGEGGYFVAIGLAGIAIHMGRRSRKHRLCNSGAPIRREQANLARNICSWEKRHEFR